MNSWTSDYRRDGFTFVEVMIAIAIVAVLAAIAIPSYDRYIERGRVAQAAADIREMDVIIAQYAADHKELPSSLTDIGKGSVVDPWGNGYQYLDLSDIRGLGGVRKDGRLNPINSDYDLYSKGKDGRSVSSLRGQPSRDDVVRASNGRFVGLASQFDP